MNIKELQTKREGKTYAENTKFAFQCVAWAKLAINELYSIQLGGFSGSAHNAFVTGSPFTRDWIKVNNSPSAVPKEGDVIFWGKSSQLPYGHVAIVIDADVNNVTVQEQNAITGNGKGIGGDAITTRKHTYRGVAGRYHYTKQDMGGTKEPQDFWKVSNELDEELKKSKELGIWNGERVDGYATRGEVAKMIYRATR